MQGAFFTNVHNLYFHSHSLPRGYRSANVASVLCAQVAVKFEDSQGPLHIPAAGPQKPREETLIGKPLIHLAEHKAIGYYYTFCSRTCLSPHHLQ